VWDSQIEADALDVLMEILESGIIKGSGKEGFINGSTTAACFQDTPMYSLGQMYYQEKLLKEKDGKGAADGADRTDFRYTLHGLAFDKKTIWDQGGRPVIYEETEIAKKFLTPDQWWRIVNLNLHDMTNLTDWTHEREWRVPGDFRFNLPGTFIILPGHKAFKKFLVHPKQKEHDFLSKVCAVIPLSPVLF
jgi:hypothetical protein